MGSALEELYREGFLTHEKGENTPPPAFDSAVFERAGEWIRKRGKFTPEMMAEQPARDVIAETFRVLDGAITDSVSTEMPDDLVGLLENNAFIFSGFKTYHSLNEVGLSLVDKTGGIRPFEKFREDVTKINDKYNQNYLRAEYNHAVASSQMASKWNEYEQSGDRYDLQYRTVGDSLVREEHARLHNITLPPSDPFWAQYAPPNGWECRCNFIRVRRGKYPTTDSAAAIALGEQATPGEKGKIFRFNPGKEMKVFPDKHPYLPKGCGSCRGRVELARGNGRPICTACEAVVDQAREREKERRKATNDAVKRWFGKYIEGQGTLTSDAFATGEMRLSGRSLKRYLGEAASPEAKWMVKRIVANPGDLVHLETSPLGKGKDMSDPVQAKNVAKKAARGVVNYNHYSFESRGRTWVIGFEVVRHGDELFEQPYSIGPKKP